MAEKTSCINLYIVFVIFQLEILMDRKNNKNKIIYNSTD